MSTVRKQVAKVLQADACSGCGVCTLLDPGLSMELDGSGYLRPVAAGPPREEPGAARAFARVCPGRSVTAQRPAGSTRHPLLGSYFGVWEAWAVDPQMRHRGSSGGALTAIQSWLLATGAVAQVSTAASDPARPTRTVPVRITSKEEALAAAGSRYAPVAVGAIATADPTHALTAKPCEVSAVRALTGGALGGSPVLLSFFCAGTPSQRATEQLVRELGGPAPEEVTELWYRGRGWPGRFTAVFDGGEVSADYDRSWGAALGPATQWRCKLCADGIGESADIAAADSWDSDDRGYPVFDEQDGRSALLARTERGLAIVLAAQEAGVIELRELDPERLARAQPLQTERRRSLAARLWGARLGGRGVPRYRGFGLVRLSLARPRIALRTLRGTLRRIRESPRGGAR
ncbi:Coenzyme F420 hydrogenase/dehydrogenase, beta subunit C-terminal domain [Leucobacter triazinivorans]|uniref:Coenzyme F420 hydrogenase/dehydrogenase, beta subunit C-terminal domain n=1 Tax=Leucobacter triazinivorans TaxID=1784719 RepID=UPI0013EEC86B|nr:Coenzyme F420 hydrogenase/dehydrogenase, beta subunit C-terminal domain [Leucobacter triazinivorans]